MEPAFGTVIAAAYFSEGFETDVEIPVSNVKSYCSIKTDNCLLK